MNTKDTFQFTFFGHKNLIMAVCFIASGFAGLTYEICWIRKASLIFGATTFAMSTVTAVFFGGLAIGSAIMGKRCLDIKRPLLVYALVEIALGCVALINPILFTWAETLYRIFHPMLAGNFVLLTLGRLAFITAVILPPTILMGTTLPLFCNYYVDSKSKISRSVALLYGLNTLGAALGCAVTGFSLIPSIGVNKTIWAAGLLNIITGAVAYRLQPLTGSPVLPNTEGSLSSFPTSGTEIQTSNSSIITGLFFLSGFVALGNQVLWTRFMSILIRNTVYTYTLTLAITLIGIVIGSCIVAGIGDRTNKRALIFGIIHALGAIIVWCLVMLPALGWQIIIDKLNSPSHLAILLLFFFIPAVLSGMSFPLAIRMAVDNPYLVGAGVGRLYAINTVGGIIGALATGFVLLPQAGLQTSLFVTTGLSICIISVSAWVFLDKTLNVKAKALLVTTFVFLWIAVPNVTGTRLPADLLHMPNQQLLDFREGYGSASLAVNKYYNDNQKTLEIDCMWQGSDQKTHQIMAAHVPMLFHPNPKNVLVVGVGTGTAPSRFLSYDVARLDCVDIEPTLFDLVRKNFESSWMDDKRVNLINEDGRNYIDNTKSSYDVISLEIGQSFRPGIYSFYTSDFYNHVRDRLNKNGIVSQFLPIDFLDIVEFKSLVRTFLEVFPNSILWYNKSELLLIGGKFSTPKLSPQRLNILSTDGPIKKDLMYTYFGGPDFFQNKKEAFLANFLCGPRSLAEISDQAPVSRDDVPAVEYSIAKQIELRLAKKPLAIIELIAKKLEDPRSILESDLDGSILSRIHEIRSLNLNNMVALDHIYFGLDFEEHSDLKKIQEAINLNPYNIEIRFILIDALRRQGRMEEAYKALKECLQLDPGLQISKELGRAPKF